jgi:hypothetical protein
VNGAPSRAPSLRLTGAATSFGQALALSTAMTLCDTAMTSRVTVSGRGAVLDYHQARRFATLIQLRALFARDRGCTFPTCDQPAQWCDAHHVIAWIDGGHTDIDNLTLVCGYHHRNFARMGWTCRFVSGIPEWIPPRHVDPDQQPRRNSRFLPFLRT